MRAAEFEKYLKQPHLMDASAIVELQKLVREFPYFQPAHILLSIASKKWDASVYQKSLRKTAAVVNNRSRLFELIHKAEPETVTTPLNSPTEEKSSSENTVSQASASAEKNNPPETITLQSSEETRQEIEILKATELSTTTVSEEKKATDDDVEKEMGRQLVSSFVEKEIIGTPELHKPVKKLETPFTFSDWLVYMRNKNDKPQELKEQASKIRKKDTAEVEKPKDGKVEERKQKNRALIDRIIESNPGLIRGREETRFFAPDSKAKESLQENEHLVTETLAKIYALQGNVGKAVRAYEILSLKFPQKSAYFAGLIQKLKNG